MNNENVSQLVSILRVGTSHIWCEASSSTDVQALMSGDVAEKICTYSFLLDSIPTINNMFLRATAPFWARAEEDAGTFRSRVVIRPRAVRVTNKNMLTFCEWLQARSSEELPAQENEFRVVLSRITDSVGDQALANFRQIRLFLLGRYGGLARDSSPTTSYSFSNYRNALEIYRKAEELASPGDFVDKGVAVNNFMGAVDTFSYDSTEAKSAYAVLQHIADLDKERVPE